MSGQGATPSLRLIHFAFSHYNEKARWALDYKGLSAERVALLPGPHARTTRKLSGQSATPIVVVDGAVVAGSARIVERLEALRPDPPLFPSGAEERAAADRWIGTFDEEVGPAVRLSLFHRLFDEPGYAAKLFSTDQPGWKRHPYAWLFPRMIPMLRDRMSIDDETDRAALGTIEEALDAVAEAVAGDGYLVGGRFTAADLTAAALLMPLGDPPRLPFSFPAVASPAHAGWRARWADHPAIAWMESMFERHR
ncbi:MAG: glutathione S-transferase N-terminal domain-containing protein [Myxococcota bacterium]